MQRIRQKQEGHSDQDRQTGTESAKRNKSAESQPPEQDGETQK